MVYIAIAAGFAEIASVALSTPLTMTVIAANGGFIVGLGVAELLIRRRQALKPPERVEG